MRGGRNVVMTVFSKHCGRLRNVTTTISLVIWKVLAPNINKIWTQKKCYFYRLEMNSFGENLLQRFVLDVCLEN